MPNTPQRLTAALAPFSASRTAIAIGDVGLHEAELADLAQRLDEIGVARIALRNPDANTASQQEFADVAADESAAAKDGHKLFIALDHGMAH